jgi:hypothetical protein
MPVLSPMLFWIRSSISEINEFEMFYTLSKNELFVKKYKVILLSRFI